MLARRADAFALASHQSALEAIDEGRFTDEIVPVEWMERTPKNGSAKPAEQKRSFQIDEGPRRTRRPKRWRS